MVANEWHQDSVCAKFAQAVVATVKEYLIVQRETNKEISNA